MVQVHVDRSGSVPARDGAVGEFTSSEGKTRSWFNPARRVIFVNGMANTPADHRKSALALSLLQGCPVIGVYNRTNGTWADLGQCLTDKLRLPAAQRLGFPIWQDAVDDGWAAARKRRPGLSKVDFVGMLIADNAATLALYKLLVSLGSQLQKTPIFCHSQGNLITSNALTALALAKGERSLSGVKVNSFGSPCRYWPRGLTHVQRAFTFDPVTWLDLRTGFQFDKVGFVAAHGFLEYMRHDGEFTVNRFRWGSFGLTAYMDEEGLADYCVALGGNTTRLLNIFERLEKAHWTDSDDVAHIYTRKMRTRHPADYRKILLGSRKLATLLIKLLEDGYTVDAEQLEIDFIRSVI